VPLAEAWATLRADLVEAGHLIPSGVRGLWGRGGTFEGVIDRFQALVTHAGEDLRAEVMHFPPLFAREAYRRTDHVETMPHLLGSVHGFEGGDAELVEMARRLHAGDEWAGCLVPTDAMLVPAACYPLYPTATGTLPPGGRTVDLLTFVYRNEPSDDPARMQSFRQREYVRLGTADEARAHRDLWLRRAQALLESLELDVTPVLANDPFFGRGGRVMKATQREQDLKYELTCPITSREKPTAVASCNAHLDHFGLAFDIRTADGEVAHSACVGFGLERIALALFSTHGMDPASWPESVRARLELTGC
jgi:seryl-tRNA synthetase